VGLTATVAVTLLIVFGVFASQSNTLIDAWTSAEKAQACRFEGKCDPPASISGQDASGQKAGSNAGQGATGKVDPSKMPSQTSSDNRFDSARQWAGSVWKATVDTAGKVWNATLDGVQKAWQWTIRTAPRVWSYLTTDESGKLFTIVGLAIVALVIGFLFPPVASVAIGFGMGIALNGFEQAFSGKPVDLRQSLLMGIVGGISGGIGAWMPGVIGSIVGHSARFAKYAPLIGRGLATIAGTMLAGTTQIIQNLLTNKAWDNELVPSLLVGGITSFANPISNFIRAQMPTQSIRKMGEKLIDWTAGKAWNLVSHK
jgi:hypothetical protein